MGLHPGAGEKALRKRAPEAATRSKAGVETSGKP